MLPYRCIMTEDADTLSRFFDKYPLKRYTAKEIILSSGEDIGSIYYVRSGIVRSYYIDENGSELTINLLKSSTYFPLSTVLAKRNNSYDFEAFTDVVVNVTPVKDTLKFLEGNSEFKSILIRSFARGLEGYVVRSFFLIKGSAMQKVASSLLLLLKRFGKKTDGGHFIDLPLTHQDIANFSGITRETVSIQIGILEKERLITRVGKYIHILNAKDLSEKASVGDDGILLPLSF